MNGVLVIDKPEGPTSFDVVRKVRHALRIKKVGHTGTLDPLATGVLPLCLGDATKIAGFITEGDKSYDAVVTLGAETDTQDCQGKILKSAPVPALSKELLEAALQRFRGAFAQLPPMFSAVKVDGRRLYEAARAGEEVERETRQVTVHELLLRDFSATELRLSVRCSKGFFVRTLAHDLGQVLGCGAHIKALRRTASGPFQLQQAVPLAEFLEKVQGGAADEFAARLVPMAVALGEMPALAVDPEEATRVSHGVPLERKAAGRVRVMAADGALLAVAEPDGRGRLKYLRVFVSGGSDTSSSQSDEDGA